MSFFQSLPKMTYGEVIPGLFPPASVWNISLAGMVSRVVQDPRAVKLICIGGLALLTAAPLLFLARRAEAGSAAFLCLCTVMVLASPMAYSQK